MQSWVASRRTEEKMSGRMEDQSVKTGREMENWTPLSKDNAINISFLFSFSPFRMYREPKRTCREREVGARKGVGRACDEEAVEALQPYRPENARFEPANYFSCSPALCRLRPRGFLATVPLTIDEEWTRGTAPCMYYSMIDRHILQSHVRQTHLDPSASQPAQQSQSAWAHIGIHCVACVACYGSIYRRRGLDSHVVL
jgi:hypothetical protein